MQKYSKILNEKGLVSTLEYAMPGFIKQNGYTMQDVAQSDIDGQWYIAEKCPMKTEEEKAQEERQKTISELKEQINNIDKQRIRALAEPSVKDEETGETWLEYYNGQIVNLREEIKKLEENLDVKEENIGETTDEN